MLQKLSVLHLITYILLASYKGQLNKAVIKIYEFSLCIFYCVKENKPTRRSKFISVSFISFYLKEIIMDKCSIANYLYKYELYLYPCKKQVIGR